MTRARSSEERAPAVGRLGNGIFEFRRRGRWGTISEIRPLVFPVGGNFTCGAKLYSKLQ